MHQAQGAAEAAACELALQALEIAVHQRLDIGVGAGGDAALVFPQLGDDLARQRDGELGKFSTGDARRRCAHARDCGRR